MKNLRRWQGDCVRRALSHFEVNRHFLCQATPGAGKTVMVATLAERLIKAEQIEMVLCFSPSISVANGIASTFSKVLGGRFDGKIGALGGSYTYQSMAHFTSEFWNILRHNKVLVVLDEIHHCSGQDSFVSNAWGQKILSEIQGQAVFTVALSGTPWRSDNTPIALARYSDPEGHIQCDYSYSLQGAISDGVCRAPKIVLIDNHDVRLQGPDFPLQSFESIRETLRSGHIAYGNFLHNDGAIEQVLQLASKKLTQIRATTPDAGGLIVASSVEHARLISKRLRAKGESSVTVTHHTPGAQDAIKQFEFGDCRWIVSVGMISEGTDIPRLQVCCHLSRVRTELHFRQVLGRILRTRDKEGPEQQAWLFMLAEPELSELAYRVNEDLPGDHVLVHKPKSEVKRNSNSGESDGWCLLQDGVPGATELIELGSLSTGHLARTVSEKDFHLEFKGRYWNQIISLFDSPF